VIVKELFAKLGLEVDEGAFSVGEKAIEILKHGLIAVGATATGAALGLAALAKKTAMSAVEAQRGAARVGVNVEAYQELKNAAEEATGSGEVMEISLRRLARAAYDASIGGAESAYNFRQVGLSVKGANGQLKPADELLMELADKFASMPDGMKKTALAMQFFGRGGAELIPLLNKGRAGIEHMREEAREFGVVLSGQTLKDAELFREALHQAEDALKGLGFALGGPLISAFTPLLHNLAEWVKENRELIAQKIHAMVDMVAFSAKMLWRVLGPLVKLMGKLVTSSLLWKAAFLAIGTYITLLAGQQLVALVKALQVAVFWWNAAGLAGLRAGLAALGAWLAAMAPLLAVIALAGLIFLIFEDLYTFLIGGNSVAGEFADKLWEVLPKAWDKVIGYFRQKWADFMSWVSNKLSAFSSVGQFFGIGASSPAATAAAGAATAGPVAASVNFGDINVQSAAGADGRQVGNDVADAIEERQQTMLREAMVAGLSG
jgi:hypothetical protein